MLLMTLALSLAGPAALPADPQTYRPPVRRTVTPRKASPRKRTAIRKRAPVQMVRLTPGCGRGLTCAATQSNPYRLTATTAAVVPDAKYRIVRGQQGMPCGTTGAPVCPGKGIKLVSAPLN